MQNGEMIRNPMQLMQSFNQFMKEMEGKNPEQVASDMMQNNPQFSQFMKSVQGKTPAQVAQEHGIDLSQIVRMIKGL